MTGSADHSHKQTQNRSYSARGMRGRKLASLDKEAKYL
jgi:hypothetical protein